MKRVILLLATIALSVGIAYAGGVVVRQNFHRMYNSDSLTVNTSTKTAVSEFVTYTYSGGSNCRFNYDSSLTGGKICLQFYGSGAQVITTKIDALDSLSIRYYYKDKTKQDLLVYVSEDGGSSWASQTVVQEINGLKSIKLPSKGDYMLKIERTGSSDLWLEQIDYHTVPCNCLRVQIE